MNYITQTSHFETILDFLRFGISKAQSEKIFFGHGTDNAWDDIYTLIMSALSLPLDSDSNLLNARLSEDEKIFLAEQLSRRIEDRVPVPYLTQEAYFAGLSFYVDERVLIPRSPIAELIRKHFAPWIDANKVHQILDLCTGSACIAIACCYAFEGAIVDAVDISKDALDVAAINRERHHCLSQLTLIQSDCFEAVPQKQYDIIVSNPPYVGESELAKLPEEYQYEPVLALEAAQNGLALVEKILRHAYDYLSDHGILVVEVGNSEEILQEAYPDAPFIWLEFQDGGQGVFVLTKADLADYFL